MKVLLLAKGKSLSQLPHFFYLNWSFVKKSCVFFNNRKGKINENVPEERNKKFPNFSNLTKVETFLAYKLTDFNNSVSFLFRKQQLISLVIFIIIFIVYFIESPSPNPNNIEDQTAGLSDSGAFSLPECDTSSSVSSKNLFEVITFNPLKEQLGAYKNSNVYIHQKISQIVGGLEECEGKAEKIWRPTSHVSFNETYV